MRVRTNMMEKPVEAALDFCVQKGEHLNNREDVIKLLLKDDQCVHSTFRYALAVKVSQFLGSHHQGLHQVYLTGSTLQNEARLTSDIDLIIGVSKNEKTVHDTLRQIDNDITNCYHKLLGEQVRKLSKIIDSKFFFAQKAKNFEETRRKFFLPPLLVWQRKTEKQKIYRR